MAVSDHPSLLRWGVAEDGATVEIELADSAQLDELAGIWPPSGLLLHDRRPTAVAGLRVEVDASGDVAVDGEQRPGGWFRVESDLALFAAERITGAVAVHAALLEWEGRGIVVPGPSHAGKSSLCVAAAAAGASVRSDEFVLVDTSSGTVTGWCRPVRVRRSDGSLERVGLSVEGDPLPASVVALLTHRPRPSSDWGVVPASKAVLGIMANTVCARSRPDEALDAALALARSAVTVAGERGDADPTVTRLLEIAERTGTT